MKLLLIPVIWGGKQRDGKSTGSASRMTAAFVVLCLWAELRHVCIAGAGGGVRKTCGFLLEKQEAKPE